MVSGRIQRGRRLEAATWTRVTTRALPPYPSRAECGATVYLACMRACRLHEGQTCAAARLTQAQGCQGLSWSHNEPSITPTYVLDCARAARSVGLFIVLVTNGLLTDAAIETLGPWLDVYRVDVQRRDDARYRRIAEDVVASLGPSASWNLATYIFYGLMRHAPATPLPTLERARAIGLRFISIDHPEALGGACGEGLNLVLPATPGDGAGTARPASERYAQGGEAPAW